MNVRPIILISLIGSLPCLAADFADTRTIEHGLRENTEVLVNSQGLAQHDLSIRGSSYTGSGVSINGLNLKAPYSAHFNSELPFIGSLLSDPAAQYGLGNVSGHLIGTAAYTTAPQEQNVQAEVSAGTPDHYTAGVSAFSSGVGGFLGGEKAQQIDHDANDLDRYSGGAYLRFSANDWLIDLIGAGQQKEFGVQGYYGQDPTVYAEQKIEDTLIFLGATHGDLEDAYFRASTALRQFDDEITGLTPLAHDVRSRFGAVMLEGRTMEIQHIALNLRGDVENEYADGQDRTRGSILLLPEVRLEHFIVKAGLNSVFQTSESAEFLPQAGIDWFANDNSQVYAAYSENVQQPDFQTLENNALLQQQKSQNTELGLRQFLSASLDWRMGGFYRKLDNASDWFGGTATNLGSLNISGLDSAINWYPSADLELQAYYQWIYKDNDISGGLYETDFPEHLLTFSGHWRLMPEFLLFASQNLRYQTENITRTSSDFGAEASLGLHYDPRFAKNVRLSFRVDNLWGSNFQAIPGLKPRPTTFSSGITVAW